MTRRWIARIGYCFGALVLGTFMLPVMATGASAVTKTPSQTSLNVSDPVSVSGQPVTLTAHVSSPVAPTGRVQFKNGTKVLGAVALTGTSSATLTTTKLAVGPVSLTATYLGSTKVLPSSALPVIGSVSPAPTTTTLIASDLAPALHEAVTITAKVTADAPSVTVPKGRVTVYNGATKLKTMSLSNGAITFVTTKLPAGAVNLTANFGGTATTLGSFADHALALTGVTLAPSTNPVEADTAINLSATVFSGMHPAPISGSVRFLEGTTSLGTVTLGDEQSTLTTSFHSPGHHLLTAQYLGDANYGESESGVLDLEVTPIAPNLTLRSLGNPANWGTSVPLIATLHNANAPTNTVRFDDIGDPANPNDDTTLGTGFLIDGEWWYTHNGFTPGVHLIRATYLGDANNPTTQSPLFVQQVYGTTAVTVTSDTNPVEAGKTVNLTAHVSSGAPGTIDGTVSFYDYSTTSSLIGTATVDNGAVTLTTAFTYAANHGIVAVYEGSASFHTSHSSGFLEEHVTASTTTWLDITGNQTPDDGAAVPYTVTVDSPIAATGLISLWDEDTNAVIDAEFITANSSAQFLISLSFGVHRLYATYSGDANHAATTAHESIHLVVSVSSLSLQIDAGYGDGCVVQLDHRVACWGLNLFGELGDGTTVSRPMPRPVLGDTEAYSVSVGATHTCLVTFTLTRNVKCWGQNTSGQLGNGTTTNSSTPVFSNLSNVDEVAAGNGFTCALIRDETVKCWGTNRSGQLGNGTTTDSSTPVTVSGLTDATYHITAGADYASAILRNGGVKCWGDNSQGQLGNNTTTTSSVPVRVSGLNQPIGAISAGLDSTCAITSDDHPWCWGSNSYGQLGNGTRTSSPVPIAVSGLTTAESISVGNAFTSATASHTAYCWGLNDRGQLGNGSAGGYATLPERVNTSIDTDLVTLGSTQSCSVEFTTWRMQCWGANGLGELGTGNAGPDSPVPVSVTRVQPY